MSAAGSSAVSEREAGAGLTARQERFVEEYLIDLNATQAAIRAGYSAKSADNDGPRLLGNAGVLAAIEEGKKLREGRTRITADRVLAELALVAFSNVDHYVIDDLGNVGLAEGAPRAAMRAVSSIKRKVRTYMEGETPVVEREIELKLWDKPGPLRIAGRHVGLFPAKDKSQIREEAKALLDEMLAEARTRRTTPSQSKAVAAGRQIIDVGTDETE